jgi:hypothetical protein
MNIKVYVDDEYRENTLKSIKLITAEELVRSLL